jgi:hypothetical protein
MNRQWTTELKKSQGQCRCRAFREGCLLQFSTHMKAAVFLATVFLATAASAADAEIRNGDFEKGKQFWRGDGKVVVLAEGAKVLELKADDKYNDEISQEIDWGKAAKMDVKFRVRSVEYKGEGLRVSANPGGSYTTPVTGEWATAKWSFNRGPAARKLQLMFSPQSGTGAIQIDDIKITASGAAK